MAEELQHYGVKGMKWGVRKARTGDINVRATRLERVAKGKGTVADKLVTFAGSSARNIKRSGGFRQEAARRAQNLRAQEERLATGKAKVTDILKAYGTVSSGSLIRSAFKKSDHERP